MLLSLIAALTNHSSFHINITKAEILNTSANIHNGKCVIQTQITLNIRPNMQSPERQENRKFLVHKPLSQLSEHGKSIPQVGAAHGLEGKMLTDLCYSNHSFINNFQFETLSNNVV